MRWLPSLSSVKPVFQLMVPRNGTAPMSLREGIKGYDGRRVKGEREVVRMGVDRGRETG